MRYAMFTIVLLGGAALGLLAQSGPGALDAAERVSAETAGEPVRLFHRRRIMLEPAPLAVPLETSPQPGAKKEVAFVCPVFPPTPPATSCLCIPNFVACGTDTTQSWPVGSVLGAGSVWPGTTKVEPSPASPTWVITFAGSVNAMNQGMPSGVPLVFNYSSALDGISCNIPITIDPSGCGNNCPNSLKSEYGGTVNFAGTKGEKVKIAAITPLAPKATSYTIGNDIWVEGTSCSVLTYKAGVYGVLISLASLDNTKNGVKNFPYSPPTQNTAHDWRVTFSTTGLSPGFYILRVRVDGSNPYTHCDGFDHVVVKLTN